MCMSGKCGRCGAACKAPEPAGRAPGTGRAAGEGRGPRRTHEGRPGGSGTGWVTASTSRRRRRPRRCSPRPGPRVDESPCLKPLQRNPQRWQTRRLHSTSCSGRSKACGQLEKITGERDEYRDSIKILGAERDELQIPGVESRRPGRPDRQSRGLDPRPQPLRQVRRAGQGPRWAKDKALRQLWRDAKDRGYKPESDDVDEKALQAAVAQLKSEVDYAFDTSDSGELRVASGRRNTARDQPHQVWAGCR